MFYVGEENVICDTQVQLGKRGSAAARDGNNKRRRFWLHGQTVAGRKMMIAFWVCGYFFQNFGDTKKFDYFYSSVHACHR